MVNAMRAISAHLDSQPQLMQPFEEAMQPFIQRTISSRRMPEAEADEHVAREIFNHARDARDSPDSPPSQTFKSLAMLLYFVYRLVRRVAVCHYAIFCHMHLPIF